MSPNCTDFFYWKGCKDKKQLTQSWKRKIEWVSVWVSERHRERERKILRDMDVYIDKWIDR